MLSPNSVEFGTNIDDGCYYIERSEAGARQLTEFAKNLYISKRTIESLRAKNVPASVYLDHFASEELNQCLLVENDPAFQRVATVVYQWVMNAIRNEDWSTHLYTVTYEGKSYGYFYQLVSGLKGSSNATETVIYKTEDPDYLRVKGFQLFITTDSTTNNQLELWAREQLDVMPFATSAYARVYYPLHEVEGQTAEGRMVMMVPCNVVHVVLKSSLNADRLAYMLNYDAVMPITLKGNENKFGLRVAAYDRQRVRTVLATPHPTDHTLVCTPVLHDVYEYMPEDFQLPTYSYRLAVPIGSSLAVYNTCVEIQVEPHVVAHLPASQNFLHGIGFGDYSTL